MHKLQTDGRTENECKEPQLAHGAYAQFGKNVDSDSEVLAVRQRDTKNEREWESDRHAIL